MDRWHHVPTSPQGSVGLRISAGAPFVVEEVVAVMDGDGVLQGGIGYGNAPVCVGDRLLAVDGYGAEELELAAPGSLHAVLHATRATVLELTLLRADDGEEYSILVRRHAIPMEELRRAVSSMQSHPASAPRKKKIKRKSHDQGDPADQVESHHAELNHLLSRLEAVERERKELLSKRRRSRIQESQLKRQQGHWWLCCRRAVISDEEQEEEEELKDGQGRCALGHDLHRHNSPPVWQCDVCEQPGRVLRRLRCVKCDYDLCRKCSLSNGAEAKGGEANVADANADEGRAVDDSSSVSVESVVDDETQQGDAALDKAPVLSTKSHPIGAKSDMAGVPDSHVPSLSQNRVLVEETEAALGETTDVTASAVAGPSQKMYTCKALTSYQARNPDEVSFIKGQIISIDVEMAEPGWYRGSTLNGHEGLVPMTHVRIVATPSVSHQGAPPPAPGDKRGKHWQVVSECVTEQSGAMGKLVEDVMKAGAHEQSPRTDMHDKMREDADEQRMERMRQEIEEKLRRELSLRTPASRSEEHFRSPPPTQNTIFQMTLGLDFIRCGEEGSALRNGFAERLSLDLGTASGAAPANFCILKFAPGSIVIDIHVRPDPMGKGRGPMAIVGELQRQVDNPQSFLRKGSISRYVRSIKVMSCMTSSSVGAQVPIGKEVSRYERELLASQKELELSRHDAGELSASTGRLWTPIGGSFTNGEKTNGNQSVQCIESQVRQFYSIYAPGKVANAKDVALLYANDPASLNRMLKLKYGDGIDFSTKQDIPAHVNDRSSLSAATSADRGPMLAVHPDSSPDSQGKYPADLEAASSRRTTPRVLQTKQSSMMSLSSADTLPGIAILSKTSSDGGFLKTAQSFPVDIQITLGLDFRACGDEGTPLRAGFAESFTKDLEVASGAAPANFCILKFAPGSIVIDIQVRPDPTGKGRGPMAIVGELQRQVENPHSFLRKGVFSSYVRSIKVMSWMASSSVGAQVPGNTEPLDAIPVTPSHNINGALASGENPAQDGSKNLDTSAVSQESIDSALRLASHEGNESCVRELVAVGADVSGSNHADGDTALTLAASAGHAGCVRELVAAGADVAQSNKVGMTPIMLAIREGHTECAQILNDAGVRPIEEPSLSLSDHTKRKHRGANHARRHHHDHHETHHNHKHRHHRRHDHPSFSVQGKVENSPHTMTPQAVEDRMLRRTPRGEGAPRSTLMLRDPDESDSTAHTSMRIGMRDGGHDKNVRAKDQGGRRKDRALTAPPNSSKFLPPSFPETTYTPGSIWTSRDLIDVALNGREPIPGKARKGGVPSLSRHGASVLMMAAGQ